MKTALIFGITGQDGSFLAEYLLAKEYEVHGVIRRASTFNTDRIDYLYRDPHENRAALRLHYGDVSDGTGLRRVIALAQPDEIYNLAAQSHVRVSFDQAEYTADVVATGTLRALEAVRDHMKAGGKPARFYQAGSSEMFGAAPPPQNEATPFYPRSPYAVSKVAAHWYAVNYREAYGLFVANGILFNHERERRGETFVTRKITRALGRIKLGMQEKLYLGNLEAKRDWGYAGDYVEAMWLMLQAREARTITWSPPANRIRCANSSTWPAQYAGWTGSGTSETTRAISGRPKSITCGRCIEGARTNSVGGPDEFRGAGAADGGARPGAGAPGADAGGGRPSRGVRAARLR